MGWSMDKVLEEGLGMAQISLAKVGDLKDMKEKATQLVENIRTDVAVKDRVEEILDEMETRMDYQLTPDFVREVDNDINEFGSVRVTKNGTIRVDGTEAFGLTLSPKEWRETRVVQLKNLLTETYRNIKRWANQLQEAFAERWEELVTTLELIDSRTDSLQNILDTVTRMRDGCKTVELSGTVLRAITKGNEPIPADIAKSVVKDVNYFSGVMKFVEAEQIRVKNSIIRYFGNPKLNDMTAFKMEMPKVLDVRQKPMSGDEGKYIVMASRPFLEGYVIEGKIIDPLWIKKEYKPGIGNSDFVAMATNCGFDLVKGTRSEIRASIVDTMSLSQMFQVLEVVKEITKYIRHINREYNPMDMDPDEIKDNLATLKANELEPARADQYALLTTDYQFRLNLIRADVSAYLTILSSHLLTLISTNLECYDA